MTKPVTLFPRNQTTYKSLTLANYESVPQIQRLSERLRWDIRVVGTVLPFKTNNYVVERLIDWDAVPNDPLFVLTFPQRDMLAPQHFVRISTLLKNGASREQVAKAVEDVRRQLNPHPAGQREYNLPVHHGRRLEGMQHKYRETVLFFPSQGQTCHAYCTFCFRWPQFVGMLDLKFAAKEADLLRDYVHEHPEITDVLFTGGDPLIMKTAIPERYIEPLLEEGVAPNLRTIRMGSKALAYWPYRFLTDDDAPQLLALFRRVQASGKHFAYMAHFNHPVELSTPETQEAIRKIRETGAQIRTQSPVMRHINDNPAVWAQMWRTQVGLGCIPYYMFVARDTGAKRFFELPLGHAWEIFRRAYQQVSGVCRTVRGPSMSATPGKVQVLGVAMAGNGKVFVLRFLQGRNPDWAARPFFAQYDAKATWLDELRPAFGQKEFFYEQELRDIMSKDTRAWQRERVPDIIGVGVP